MSAKKGKGGKIELKSEETDRVIKLQREALAENLQHFMESIPELNKRYNEYLEVVKGKNPKGSAETRGASGTPLLKRHRGEPAGAAAQPAGPAEPGSPRVGSPSKADALRPPPKGPGDLPKLPDNSELLEQLAHVKHESYELTTMLNGIVDWISLSIPQIKDEDNLGVEVQERVLQEISGLLKVVNATYEAELSYLQGRAEHESQYYKHFLALQREALAENLQHFMESIPELNKRYNEYLEVVKGKNPKGSAETRGASGTPLLKRHRGEPAGAAAQPAGPAEPGSPRVGSPSKADALRPPPKGPGDLPKLPDNSELLEQLAHVKHESYELTTMLNGIVDWISLSIPQIKDEDNLGVEVQERVLQEISGLLKVVNATYEAELSYLQGRAEHESQYYKHFLAQSWYRVIEAHDLSEWDDLERGWRDMVRVTINAYSVLSKNMEKLKNPRRAAPGLCM
eukprot:TRINITY_DN16546_c0_g1_i1.p1 TRINITY_DN16546_c0_g1~~TRINITY_DN16546_c0_g1_i1.p1  ORF type:complete len:487 (+),score=170.44 TRINITY_DN16546_c0_g1_i1:99-1463(+)